MTKNIIYLILILIFFNSCTTAKDVLSGKKKSNESDQFLIKKKNPLILPPDFETLPKPNTLNESQLDKEKEDIKSILNKNNKISKSESKIQNENTSLDELILKKIKKN